MTAGQHSGHGREETTGALAKVRQPRRECRTAQADAGDQPGQNGGVHAWPMRLARVHDGVALVAVQLRAADDEIASLCELLEATAREDQRLGAVASGGTETVVLVPSRDLITVPG